MLSPSDSPVSVRLKEEAGFPVLVFSWHHDRWAWRIESLTASETSNGDDAEPRLQSIEGDSDSDWPPSPPIQQVMIEDRNTHQVVLGVGMAGSSHWSISFEPGQQNSIVVDNACKTNGDEGFVGSTFQVSKNPGLSVSDAQLHSCDDNRCTITPNQQSTATTFRWIYQFEYDVVTRTNTNDSTGIVN